MLFFPKFLRFLLTYFVLLLVKEQQENYLIGSKVFYIYVCIYNLYYPLQNFLLLLFFIILNLLAY